jgi:hypothetical protein
VGCRDRYGGPERVGQNILEKSLYKDQTEWLWLLKMVAFLLLPVCCQRTSVVLVFGVCSCVLIECCAGCEVRDK